MAHDSAENKLETLRSHVNWGHNWTKRNIGGTFNKDQDFYNVSTMCPVTKMWLAFSVHETVPHIAMRVYILPSCVHNVSKGDICGCPRCNGVIVHLDATA